MLNSLICNTTNYSKLITIGGMLKGYFTSPLIATYSLGEFVPSIKSMGESEKEMAHQLIEKQQRRLFKAQQDGIDSKVIGQRNMRGLLIDIIESVDLTPEILDERYGALQ